MNTAVSQERGFRLEERGAHYGHGAFTLVELNANRTFKDQRLATRGFRFATKREASQFFSDANVHALSQQTSTRLEVIVFESDGCFAIRSIWDQFADVTVSEGDPGNGYYALCVNLPGGIQAPETIH